MTKIKLTKNELKKQRDSLKQFLHYLPTLQLKKQQLQMKILQARKAIEEKLVLIKIIEEKINRWVGLLAELDMDLERWIAPAKVLTETVNIAGAEIPLFKEARFNTVDYDFYAIPFWVDKAVAELQELAAALAEVKVIKKQIEILEHELRVTTQRVNLFEKVKIPECLENIRVIRIYLGDQMANAVGISKVAKNKIAQVAV